MALPLSFTTPKRKELFLKQAAKQQPASAPNDGDDMSFAPGHVMTREHYERLAREAAGQK